MGDYIMDKTGTFLDKAYDSTIKTIDDFKKNCNDDHESQKNAKNYLEWLTLKTEIVQNEKEFVIPNDKKDFIRRSYVHWVHFGYNIGKEFGGHHPAVILKVDRHSVYVLPLSSGRVPEHKRDKSYCVDIPFVYDFPSLPRWTNVYRLVCISKMRIDFQSSLVGRIKGTYMDKINEAMDSVGLKI